MTVEENRLARQAQVHRWCIAAFGSGHALNVEQRGLRLAEEAIEAAQSAGCSQRLLHKLIDYVYARPVGELQQEIGGVSTTLLALAAAAGMWAEECEKEEIARVLAKPLEHFAARNQEKNEAGFVAGG